MALAAGAANASSGPRFLGCSAYLGGHPRNANGASAVGTAHANDCKPFCAAGRVHAYPVTVTLSAPRRCAGKLELTRVNWRYTTARRPAGATRTGFDTFHCA